MTSVSVSVVNMWPRCSRGGSKRAVVIDLAVQDEHNRAILVVDGLVASDEIDDTQSLDPEADPRFDEQTS